MKKDSKILLFERMAYLNPDFKLKKLEEEVVRSTNSSTPTLDLGKKYTQNESRHKPNGLWYEINGDWVRWCSYEMPSMLKKFDIQIDLDMTHILVLNTYEEAFAFNKKYATIEILKGMMYYIDWGEVAKSYKGIEIPNISNIRKGNLYNEQWVYTWDVNSGCVWDLSAVKSYKAKDCTTKPQEDTYDYGYDED